MKNCDICIGAKNGYSFSLSAATTIMTHVNYFKSIFEPSAKNVLISHTFRHMHIMFYGETFSVKKVYVAEEEDICVQFCCCQLDVVAWRFSKNCNLLVSVWF